MGNCYGEDGDLEDEYYGYYSKNNCLKPKPKPNPTPLELEQEHHEGQELKELIQDRADARIDWEEGQEGGDKASEQGEIEYEDEEIKVNKHGTYEYNHLVYNDDTHKLKEPE